MSQVKQWFKKIMVGGVVVASIFFGVITVSAQTPAAPEWNTIKYQAKALNQLPYTNAADIIGLVIRGLMMFMGAIMFGLVVYAGFLWMTAQGNGEKIEQAKGIIVWATLGVAVMMVSYVIVNFVFGSLQTTSAPTVADAGCTGKIDGFNCTKDVGVPMVCYLQKCIVKPDFGSVDTSLPNYGSGGGIQSPRKCDATGVPDCTGKNVGWSCTLSSGGYGQCIDDMGGTRCGCGGTVGVCPVNPNYVSVCDGKNLGGSCVYNGNSGICGVYNSLPSGPYCDCK